MRLRALALTASLVTAVAAAPAVAQTGTAAPARPWAPDSVTAAAYTHAASFLFQNTAPLVTGQVESLTWLPDGRFWYRTTLADGPYFYLVDPAGRRKAELVDLSRLAGAMATATGQPYSASLLPVRTLRVAADARSLEVRLGYATYDCDLGTYRCAQTERPGAEPHPDEVVSPDGTKAAFLKDHNLWMRDLGSGAETPLTTDGVEDFGYATNNAGWVRSDRPVLRWSPDSRRIATFQQDDRGVGMMYLVSTAVGHPKLDAWRYPLPEDSVIFRLHRVVIDVQAPGGPRVVRLKMPPDQHRSTTCDHVYCGGTFTDVEWSPDGSSLAFVSTSRDHKTETLRVADPVTGDVRDVLTETVPDFFESGFNGPNWRFLPGSNEVIWFSQRDDWGHLYLYDLGTGKLKRQITSGDWNVLEILKTDRKGRSLLVAGAGREPGDPYFRYVYRVGMDGGAPTLLTPDSADHQVSLSPSGDYFVDTWSTPTTPPVSALRDARGRTVLTLEKADVSKLVATGWQPPIPFSVKARDGVTDLYGLMYRPTTFDPSRKYPIVNHIYPGPQTGSVGSRAFRASRGDAQALAELGFVVVELDAMGTPMRSKSFHAKYYGDMGDNGLPDQVTGMKQLAARYPWIDLDRAGIYGHSGGGYASADAILRYPDFFKVAVAEAGNHDNRIYEDDWGEKWQGLLVTHPDGSTSYDNQANQLLARNLQGKLLLAYGTMDDNVPPNNTLVLVDSLIAADKDFDLIAFPNRHHGFGNEPYMIRRRWDYFVENLLGAEPPKGFSFTRR